jgi:hypothetical protein
MSDRKRLAIRIAQNYPVTSAYVESLLEEFSEEQTRTLLDYYSSVGQFPSVARILEGLGKGLGRRK